MRSSAQCYLILFTLLLVLIQTGNANSKSTIVGEAISSDLSGYRSARGAPHPELVGRAASPKAAKGDTIYVLGGPALDDGDFETAGGDPDWDGWTSIDRTAPETFHWHVDTYQAAGLERGLPGTNYAWWCGEDLPSCGGGDIEGGYGNSYEDYLDYYGDVASPTDTTHVSVMYNLRYDNEPGYDYLYLQLETQYGLVNGQTFNGTGEIYQGTYDDVFLPADYVTNPNTGNPAFHLRFYFDSDGAWSDEDCLWPTAGAAQVDSIVVSGDNGVMTTVETVNDGDPDYWQMTPATGVGDFAKVWPLLDDIDPCRINRTPQVAFIDDGEVVPGTGGSQCGMWCYGPEGYVVNVSGGLLGASYRLWNEIWSPVIAWPGSGYEGSTLAFDVFRHENVGPNSGYIFYVWNVRSTADPTGASGWTEWRNRGFANYGGPDYYRHEADATGLLEPGCSSVQVSLGAWQYYFWWWPDPYNAKPAPYFDNVALKAYAVEGPSLLAHEEQLAQDGFPASGIIDYVDLGANSVRFDMAQNIAPLEHGHIDAGDSVVVTVQAIRAGASLVGPPEMH